MTTRWARFGRGWLAAVFSTFVAACLHELAGGPTPSAVGIALSLAFSGLVCMALASKRLSIPKLALSVAISQFMFHGAFSLIGEAGPMTGAATSVHDLHHHGLQTIGTTTGGSHMLMVADARMWLGHAVTAVLSFAALRYGERAFWGLFDLARVYVTAFTFAPATITDNRPVRSSVVAIARALLPSRHVFLLSAVSHRGPPRAVTSH